MAKTFGPGQTVRVFGVPAIVLTTGPRLTVVRCQGRTLTVSTKDVDHG